MGTWTKQQIRERLGVDTDTEVAAFFGITLSAVSQWPMDGPIPELRQLQAERKRPDLFGGPDPAHRPEAANRDDGEAAATDGIPVQPVSEAA